MKPITNHICFWAIAAMFSYEMFYVGVFVGRNIGFSAGQKSVPIQDKGNEIIRCSSAVEFDRQGVKCFTIHSNPSYDEATTWSSLDSLFPPRPTEPVENNIIPIELP